MVGFQDEISTLDQGLYERTLSNPNIIYTGAVENVEKYYSAMDILLLPSYREGFGNVVIEAAAMGTPAIVSEIPGPIDTSIKNKTALWTQVKNVESLVEAMLISKTCAKTMSKECVNYVRECFDQNVLNQFILERKNKLIFGSKTISKG
jgi:glycosyltransferase involved in cell wall biosynthesis